jgi:hypothetical protein
LWSPGTEQFDIPGVLLRYIFYVPISFLPGRYPFGEVATARQSLRRQPRGELAAAQLRRFSPLAWHPEHGNGYGPGNRCWSKRGHPCPGRPTARGVYDDETPLKPGSLFVRLFWMLPPSKNFTIFEGTSEIQRMLIGRAVTGLDVR